MSARLPVGFGKDGLGKNLKAAPKKISHKDLERWDEGGYKSTCPECKKGLLLVHRHHKTLRLINIDRCTWCGQQFEYTDKTIAGEPVTDVVSS